ncbi:hypothetical protein A3A67_01550 [Candidatus Peribacteria bacterium RIFCSPLOWO2_01_FULL_51_18]|nr:MAG: hypothetical protein A3A67_01550 [Candidatus Peribacteria bacterium RIFCSPLOWO2_01_FULL_51_18]
MRKKISTNSNGRKDLYTRTRARIRTRIYKYARKNAQASRIKIIPPVSLAAVLVLFIAVGVTLLSAQEISGDSASGSVISNNSGSDIEARNISGSILNPQTGQTEGAEGTEGTDPAPPEGFAEASVAGVTSNQSLRSGSGRAGVENENIPVASLSINSSVGTISGSFLNESGSGSIAESQAASGDLISSLSISSSAKAYSGAILSSDSPVSSDSSVSSVSSVPLVTQLQSGVLPSATHPTFWISSNAAASSEELFDRLNIEAKNSPLRPGATGATEGQAGEELSVTKTVSESGTGYLVTLDFGKSVKPMKVELTLRLSEQVHGLGRVADMITGPDETVVWQGTVEIGRLIMNTDKATYRRGDTAEVSLTLLDEAGSALCGSDIEALLYSPDGTLTERYSTSDGTLETRNCLNRTVGIEPDYEFKVKLAQEGMYELVVTEGKEGKVGKEGKEGKVGKEGKESKEGKVGDSDIAKTALKIQVVSNAEPFSITRKSITRTLGKDETMELDVYANETVVGKISEIVPGDVTISEVSVGGSIERSGDDQKITWEKILQAGTSTTVSYSFKVDSDPASSADFAEVRETRIETFGPAEIEGTEDTGGTEGTDVSKDNLNTSATSVTSVSSGSSLSINSSVGMMSGSILNGSGSSLPSLFSETGMTNSSDEARRIP